MAPTCSECGETLVSHVGRIPSHIWYHHHVVYGPYPNPDPHRCSLVNEAFDDNGVYLKGSGEARKALAEAIHGHKKNQVETVNETWILANARKEVDRILAGLKSCLGFKDSPEFILREPNLKFSILNWERLRDILKGEING